MVLCRLLFATLLLCMLWTSITSTTTHTNQHYDRCTLLTENQVILVTDVVHNGNTYQGVNITIPNTYRGYKCRQNTAVSGYNCVSSHRKAQPGFVTYSSGGHLSEKSSTRMCRPSTYTAVHKTVQVTLTDDNGNSFSHNVYVTFSNITECECSKVTF